MTVLRPVSQFNVPALHSRLLTKATIRHSIVCVWAHHCARCGARFLGGIWVVVSEDPASSTMTRKTLLLTVAGAAASLVLGRFWSSHGVRRTTTTNASPRRADNLLEETSGGGIVLRPTPVDPRGPVYRLNRPAALIWHSIDGRRTADDIAALLATAYGIPRKAARTDTLTCLRTFTGAGLVIGAGRQSAA